MIHTISVVYCFSKLRDRLIYIVSVYQSPAVVIIFPRMYLMPYNHCVLKNHPAMLFREFFKYTCKYKNSIRNIAVYNNFIHESVFFLICVNYAICTHKYSLLVVLVSVSYNSHWYVCMMHYVITNTAHERLAQSSQTT